MSRNSRRMRRATMDEPNKTAATEPETRPEAAKLQDAPRRRVGSLTLGACLIAAGIFFLCYYFVPGFDWQLVVRIAPAAALVLLGCEVLFFAARPGRCGSPVQRLRCCRRGHTASRSGSGARHLAAAPAGHPRCWRKDTGRCTHPAGGGPGFPSGGPHTPVWCTPCSASSRSVRGQGRSRSTPWAESSGTYKLR